MNLYLSQQCATAPKWYRPHFESLDTAQYAFTPCSTCFRLCSSCPLQFQRLSLWWQYWNDLATRYGFYPYPLPLFSNKFTVRKRSDSDSHGPVTDTSLLDIRCGKDASTAYAPGILSVAAGQTVSFAVDPDIQHPGPGLAYLAKVPTGETAADWDGSGAVWFKVWEEGPSALNSNGGDWPTTGMYSLSERECMLIWHRSEDSRLHNPKSYTIRWLSCTNWTHRPPCR